MRLASIGERRAYDAEDPDFAGVGGKETGDQAQGRRLSGAVGAEQRIELAGGNCKVEPIDSRPAEALGQGPQHEGRNIWSGHLLSRAIDATQSSGWRLIAR